MESLSVLAERDSLSFSTWYVSLSGVVLPNEVLGEVCGWLLEVVKPRDPKLPPSELYAYPAMEHFQEYAMVRNWMSSFLVKWYVLISSDYKYEDLLESPAYRFIREED